MLYEVITLEAGQRKGRSTGPGAARGREPADRKGRARGPGRRQWVRQDDPDENAGRPDASGRRQCPPRPQRPGGVSLPVV